MYIYIHIYIRGSFDKFGKFPWNGATIHLMTQHLERSTLRTPSGQISERMHNSCLVIIWSEIGAQKSALPSRQRAVPQIDHCNDKTTNWAMNWFLIHLFSGFGPVWLLSVPKLKNLARWEKFSSNEEVIVAINEYFANFETAYFKWLSNVNYASFLVEIWLEGVRRVDLSRCRVIKWIVAPFFISWKFTKLIKRPTYIYICIYFF